MGPIFGRRFTAPVLLLALAMGAAWAGTAAAQEIELEVPRVVLDGVEVEVTIHDPGEAIPPGTPLVLQAGPRLYTSESTPPETVVAGVVVHRGETLALLDQTGAVLASTEPDVIPAWFAILPSLVAIGLALALRQVIPACSSASGSAPPWSTARCSASGTGCSTSSPTTRWRHSPTAATARSSSSR